MRNLYIWTAAICMLLISCDKIHPVDNNKDTNEKMVKVSFTAVCMDETKTHLASNGYSVTWQNNDAISVFAKGNNYKFTLESGHNQTTGIFTGNIKEEDADATEFYALYPYDENATISDNIISAKGITNKINYVKNTFPNNVVQSVAYAKRGENFTFKLVGALMAVTVPSSMDKQLNKITVASNASEKFSAGDVQITVKESDAPEVALTNGSGSSQVYMNKDEGIEGDATYYLPVYPVTLTRGLRVVMAYRDSRHDEYLFNGSEIVVGRTDVFAMSVVPQPTYKFETFDKYQIINEGTTSVGKDNYITGNTNALKIVKNPVAGSADTDLVLFDDYPVNSSTSGYVTLELSKDVIKAKFPYGVRTLFDVIRCEVYLGANEYFPHLKANTKSSNASVNPTKVNGHETSGKFKEDVADFYNHNAWNTLEWSSSDLLGQTNFGTLDNLQFRMFVDYNNNNAPAQTSSPTNTKQCYLNNIEFLYK